MYRLILLLVTTLCSVNAFAGTSINECSEKLYTKNRINACVVGVGIGMRYSTSAHRGLTEALQSCANIGAPDRDPCYVGVIYQYDENFYSVPLHSALNRCDQFSTDEKEYMGCITGAGYSLSYSHLGKKTAIEKAKYKCFSEVAAYSARGCDMGIALYFDQLKSVGPNLLEDLPTIE